MNAGLSRVSTRNLKMNSITINYLIKQNFKHPKFFN